MISNKVTHHENCERKYFDDNATKIIFESNNSAVWRIPEKIILLKNGYFPKNRWKFLDIGCGPAKNIKANLGKYFLKDNQYFGIDISSKLLKEAKKNLPKGNFIKSPMSLLKFSEDSFDLVSFFGSLHHDENPKRSLNLATKFLKKGGYLLLREPRVEAFAKGFGASPNESGLNSRELKKWLNDLNFSIINWYFLNTPFSHLIRRLLNKFWLKKFESSELFWVIMTYIEILLNKIKVYSGYDMFIVARKK